MTLFFDVLLAFFVIACLTYMAVLAGRQHRSLTGRPNRNDKRRLIRNRAKQRKHCSRSSRR